MMQPLQFDAIFRDFDTIIGGFNTMFWILFQFLGNFTDKESVSAGLRKGNILKLR